MRFSDYSRDIRRRVFDIANQHPHMSLNEALFFALNMSGRLQ